MKEINAILALSGQAQQQGKRTALATVVHVEGSSYRRPGARMLVTEDGLLAGSISGGCLEGDALRKALFVMNKKQSQLVTYDTMDEDDAKLGIGLGCNGIIEVLIEPIDTHNPLNPVELLRTVSAGKQKAVLVTLFSLRDKREEQPGTCLLLKEDQTFSTGNNGFFREKLLTDAEEALLGQRSAFKNYLSGRQSMDAFIEYIPAPVTLVVIGAGNDVIPLIDMATVLGWETIVIDGRPQYASPERFAASCRVLTAKPEQALEKISIQEQTVFVLMTHNYNYDLAMLKALVDKKAAYIGSLGPKKKLDRMIAELKGSGIPLSEDQLSHIYGPAGLDLGAETPEEIALSILSEIKSVLSAREVRHLRDNSGSIHPRSDTLIEKVEIGRNAAT